MHNCRIISLASSEMDGALGKRTGFETILFSGCEILKKEIWEGNELFVNFYRI